MEVAAPHPNWRAVPLRGYCTARQLRTAANVRTQTLVRGLPVRLFARSLFASEWRGGSLLSVALLASLRGHSRQRRTGGYATYPADGTIVSAVCVA